MGLWSSIGGGIGSAIGSIWGPAGAAIGQQAGQDLGAIPDYFQNKHDARDAASRANGYMLYMQNTAHQREVNDLRAAGLNPVLSVMGGTGAGFGQVPVNSAYNRDYNNAAEAEGYASARRIREQNEREKELNNAQVSLLEAQRLQSIANAKKANSEAEISSAELPMKLRESLAATEDSYLGNFLKSIPGYKASNAYGVSRIRDKLEDFFTSLFSFSGVDAEDVNRDIDKAWNSKRKSDLIYAKNLVEAWPSKSNLRSKEEKAEAWKELKDRLSPRKNTIVIPTSGEGYWKTFGEMINPRESYFRK